MSINGVYEGTAMKQVTMPNYFKRMFNEEQLRKIEFLALKEWPAFRVRFPEGVQFFETIANLHFKI